MRRGDAMDEDVAIAVMPFLDFFRVTAMLPELPGDHLPGEVRRPAVEHPIGESELFLVGVRPEPESLHPPCDLDREPCLTEDDNVPARELLPVSEIELDLLGRHFGHARADQFDRPQLGEEPAQQRRIGIRRTAHGAAFDCNRRNRNRPAELAFEAGGDAGRQRGEAASDLDVHAWPARSQSAAADIRHEIEIKSGELKDRRRIATR